MSSIRKKRKISTDSNNKNNDSKKNKYDTSDLIECISDFTSLFGNFLNFYLLLTYCIINLNKLLLHRYKGESNCNK
jgi:hypothetical protein